MLLMHPKSDPVSLPPLPTLTWIASMFSDLPIFTSPFCPPTICSQPSSPGEFISSPVLRTFCLLPSRIKGPCSGLHVMHYLTSTTQTSPPIAPIAVSSRNAGQQLPHSYISWEKKKNMHDLKVEHYVLFGRWPRTQHLR